MGPAQRSEVISAATAQAPAWTAIVAAMASELRPLHARIQVDRVCELDGLRTSLGRLAGSAVALAVTGEGHELARRATTTLLQRLPVERLIVTGMAGGLSPGLQPGQVVMAHAVLDHRGPVGTATTWTPWPAGVLPVTVVSSEGILSRARDKRAAWQEAGVDGAAVVDLESAACVGIATELGVPYVVVRAVCDPAEEDLPFDLETCRDRHGAVSRFKVVRHALLRPGTMGGLWDLRRRVALGAEQLAEVIEQLLQDDGQAR